MINTIEVEKELLYSYIKTSNYEVIINKCKDLFNNSFVFLDEFFNVKIFSDESVKERKEIKKFDKKYIFLPNDNPDELEIIENDFNLIEYLQYKEYPFIGTPLLIKKINYKNVTFGYLIVFVKNKSELEKEKKIIKTLELIINHDLAIRKYEKENDQIIFKNLINDKYGDSELNNIENSRINNAINNNKLVVIKVKNNKQRIIQTLNKNNLLILIDNNNIITFMNDLNIEDNKTIDEIIRCVGKENICFGVSDKICSIGNIKKAYNEAIEAIDVGKIFYPNKTINEFNDYALISAVRNLDKKTLDLIIDQRVIKLIKYDKEQNTRLLEELKLYLSLERKIKETANALFLHKNTMYYHMNKIKEISGIDIENSDDCFKVELSLKIMKIINKK